MSQAHLEIWFYSPEEVAVFLESAETGQAKEIVEIGVFAAYAARQIANLQSGVEGQTLAKALAELPSVDPIGEVPTELGDIQLVPARGRGHKGFVATIKVRADGVPLISLKPHGFGLLGRGTAFYAPTSTLALLYALLGRQSPEGRFLLTETARNVGRLGLAGRIGVTSQHVMAHAAISAAVNALEETAPEFFARADDREEDYQILLGKAQRALIEVVEERLGGAANQIPSWLPWRVSREWTLIHHGEYDGEAYAMHERAAWGPDEEYDRYLLEATAERRLEDIARRVHGDCVSALGGSFTSGLRPEEA